MSERISVTSLAASSAGNAYYLKYGDVELLIDAGISAKCICDKLKELGTDIGKIRAIFVTHEHIDHVKGLEVLSKRCQAPIYMTRLSANEYLSRHPYTNNIIKADSDIDVVLDGLRVRSFFASHDSCSCVGYVFETESDRFGIATDTGYVAKAAVEALVGCSSVVLESNYDEKRLESGPYPQHLKDRIRSNKGHLSNYDCAALARYLAERGTRNFMLGHLSNENNTPEIALNVSSRALAGFEGIVLKVASRKDTTRFT